LELLSQLRGKRSKGLLISVDFPAINEAMVAELDNLCQTFKGDCSVKLQITDKNGGYLKHH
jgi:DNA polymerase-3 subunit alpha